MSASTFPKQNEIQGLRALRAETMKEYLAAFEEERDSGCAPVYTYRKSQVLMDAIYDINREIKRLESRFFQPSQAETDRLGLSRDMRDKACAAARAGDFDSAHAFFRAAIALRNSERGDVLTLPAGCVRPLVAALEQMGTALANRVEEYNPDGSNKHSRIEIDILNLAYAGCSNLRLRLLRAAKAMREMPFTLLEVERGDMAILATALDNYIHNKGVLPREPGHVWRTGSATAFELDNARELYAELFSE